MPPTITPDRTSSIARSSNRRINRTVRYRSARFRSALEGFGTIAPDHRAVLGIGVVGPAVREPAHQRVVVVRHGAAVAQLEPAVFIGRVLKVQRDGAPWPVAAVRSAAVISAAVMEAQVPLGDLHPHLADLGVVESGVLREDPFEV